MIEIPKGYVIVKTIVRCKDCKYWEKSFGYNCKEYWDCKLGLKDTSVCGFYSGDGHYRKELGYGYCPNCGAKMDEVEK